MGTPVKRLIASAIDQLACANPIGIVGILANSYLYYGKGTTLGLMVFNLRLVQQDEKKPSMKVLFKRFAYKYLGLLLLYVIASLTSNIVAYIVAVIIQYVVPEGTAFAIIVFLSKAVSGVAIFGIALLFYYKKNMTYRREKSTKTHYITEKKIIDYVLGKKL